MSCPRSIRLQLSIEVTLNWALRERNVDSWDQAGMLIVVACLQVDVRRTFIPTIVEPQELLPTAEFLRDMVAVRAWGIVDAS
jgi:hypothetical protein